MKITLFTSNQPRHLALIERMQAICDELFVFMECKTLFPGVVKDTEQKSTVMERYFERVQEAERLIFERPRFVQKNINLFIMKTGDLSLLDQDVMFPALQSDYYVVFGASYIRGWLIDFLVENKAINIHMGVSPYYRGSSSNFWPLFDGNPLLVGSTIHLLSKGLDNGDILFHAMPEVQDHAAFEYSMRAVLSAHVALIQRISDKTIFSLPRIPQSKLKEIRYTKHIDFTDEVAEAFLSRDLSNSELIRQIKNSPKPMLVNPFYY